MLERIEQSILTDKFEDIESEVVEIKGLSNKGKWRELYKSVCAFLNTNGGILIVGVTERNKKYNVTGFDKNNESNVLELHSKIFRDSQGKLIDLSDYIHCSFEKLFQKDILVVAVYPLPEDQKYVHYDGGYYERKLTQDQKIPESKLLRQKEYKAELAYAKEIMPVEGATQKNFSLEKINRYVMLLNKEIRTESIKPSIKKAQEFLFRQHFIKNEQITTLGLLVCGEDPFHFLGTRAEVSCFYDTENNIAADKKIFRNDVISLMDDTFQYVWRNIKIARTAAGGGSSLPEYPEQLTREVFNNALAHRDYTIEQAITINIEPNKYLEVKNPGTFKEKMRIKASLKKESGQDRYELRYIVPGIPESKNPKLASVLKVFDKIENQGRGMASLVNATLANEIDVPYFQLKSNQIALRIPTGKLVDDQMEHWLNSFEVYITRKMLKPLHESHKKVLAYFYKSAQLAKKECYTVVISDSNNHLDVLNDFFDAGILLPIELRQQETSVYRLDPVLMKIEYPAEIAEILGTEQYLQLDETARHILNIVYVYSHFNKQSLRASEITPEVYRRQFGQVIDAKKHESLGRKVRGYCNRLVEQGIFEKDDKKAYFFNTSGTVNSQKSLF